MAEEKQVEVDLSALWDKIKNLPQVHTDHDQSVRNTLFALAAERAQVDTITFWLLDVLLSLTDDTEVVPETPPPPVQRLLSDTRAQTSFKQVRDIISLLDIKLKHAIDSMIRVEVTMDKEDREVIHAWLLAIKSCVDTLTGLTETTDRRKS